VTGTFALATSFARSMADVPPLPVPGDPLSLLVVGTAFVAIVAGLSFWLLRRTHRARMAKADEPAAETRKP
jgi:hypothetical protein